MPPGLSLDSFTGRISGTPTRRGTFAFTVALADIGNNNVTTSASLSIVVR